MTTTNKPMTAFDACAIVEGFDGRDHDTEETLEAWAFLVSTGLCWQLQGWYGRTATRLIERGLLTKEGQRTNGEPE